MLVKEIHTIVRDSLYAVQWDGECDDCLTLLLDRFTDVEYLTDFFTLRLTGLSYYRRSDIIEAVVDTMQEIQDLNEELRSLASGGVGVGVGRLNLTKVFTSLDNRYYRMDFKKAKAKGDPGIAPWIRIYGVKIDTNEYVISGGAIKLVKKMSEDPLLELELRKMEALENDLKFKGVI